ncbi:MAG TPA: serine hydrolase [Trebonia sp.]|jgi:hypothetical protein|nr:serine hydrolase [Trebonia sp.]
MAITAKTVTSRVPTPKARQSAQHALDDGVSSLVRADDDHVAVAVDDLTASQSAGYNDENDQFVTASIVKVDILATLLYQDQGSDQLLSDYEQDLATTMIENSDDDSASALYGIDGGAEEISEANDSFGLRDTVVGTSGYWGLTTTTAADQIRLLRQVFTSSSVLSPASRDYIQSLMSQVESDQQWGVPAAADAGTRFMVKNGWLPNPDLWEINSIGEVTHDGQRMLVAVLSDDNETENGGISLVEDIAKKAVDAMAP